MSRKSLSVLEKAYSNNRLSHAMLFKLWPHDDITPENAPDFFETIEALLCAEPSSSHLKACGKCSSCQLFAQWQHDSNYQVHPDFICLNPESPQGYTVEQIREMIRFLALKSHLSPRRLVIINKAELLRAAHGAPANALLEILEEPRPSHHLFLLSAHPELLLATLRSRCQHFSLRLQGPEPKVDEEWLPLLRWIEAACPPNKEPLTSPADQEAFWKDRQTAIKSLELSFKQFWKGINPHFAHWNTQQSHRVLDFFEGMEDLIQSVRGFGNGLLQWQNLKTHALKDLLWKP